MSRKPQTKTSENPRSSRRAKKLNGKEKMRKHINDINDQITDEDIRNVTIEPYLEYPNEQEGSEEDRRKNNNGDRGDTSEQTTPWNVVN
jgi:hypothetical protein